jgi:nucleolysin TIA-1/TIAR
LFIRERNFTCSAQHEAYVVAQQWRSVAAHESLIRHHHCIYLPPLPLSSFLPSFLSTSTPCHKALPLTFYFFQFQSKGFNYGFVEYDDPGAAERAMQTLNGRRVHQQEIRVNWAYQSNTVTKEDTSNHFHIFVGDLSNEVNDEVLLQAFSAFGTVSEARVMWDMKTGRSRGYGFVAFRDRGDAEKALSNMDGEWLGSRAIRCNWANQKGQPSYSQQQAMTQMGMTPTTPFGHHSFPTQGANSYEMVVQQTPAWQTTCYVGNLTPYTTQNDLVPLFQNFGYVTETRFQSDRGFAFVKMDTHENAANAICQLNGYQVNGRPLKCSVS